MWYENVNGSVTKPEELDTTSSKKYVYVRKNFQLVEATEDVPAHWKWQETKILRDDWEIYRGVMEHGDALDDVYAALTELAELIVGEE